MICTARYVWKRGSLAHRPQAIVPDSIRARPLSSIRIVRIPTGELKRLKHDERRPVRPTPVPHAISYHTRDGSFRQRTLAPRFFPYRERREQIIGRVILRNVHSCYLSLSPPCSAKPQPRRGKPEAEEEERREAKA